MSTVNDPHPRSKHGYPTQWEGRIRQRQHTKAGPGRMPFNRAQGISGAKLWRACPDKRRDLWRDELFRPGHPLVSL